jgi:hypothetical protein
MGIAGILHRPPGHDAFSERHRLQSRNAREALHKAEQRNQKKHLKTGMDELGANPTIWIKTTVMIQGPYLTARSYTKMSRSIVPSTVSTQQSHSKAEPDDPQ